MAALAGRVAMKIAPKALDAASKSLMKTPGPAGPTSGSPVAAANNLTVNTGPMPSYTAADKARELELDMQEQAERNEQHKMGLESRRVRAMNRMAKSNFSLFLLAFLKDLSPYIVLAVVILVIIGGAKSASAFRPLRDLDAKRKKEFSKAKSRFERLKTWIKTKLKWLIKLITPSYRVRLFVRMLLPFGGKGNQIPRQRIMSGRCDNHRWIQVNENGDPDLDMDGRRGYCFSAIRPENIEWELDVSRMPDYNDLPQQTKKSMQSRMTVVIPYDDETSVKDGNTFFVPRCDKAYYKNAKDANGKNVPATLLEDMGTSCKLGSHPFVKGSYGSADMKKLDLIKNRKW